MIKSSKISIILSLIFLVISCSPKIEYSTKGDIIAPKKTSGYVFATNDIPLLSGLEIIEEESTNFDTIAGNIAIASYVGEFKQKEVKDFYIVTLPQIGYILKRDSEKNIFYKRGRDKLEISFADKDGELIVKFLITSN